MVSKVTEPVTVALDGGETLTVNVVRAPSPVVFLSRINCETRGIEPGKWARTARQAEADGVPVTRLGAARLIAAEAFDAWLAGRAKVRPSAKPSTPDDATFARVGLKVVGT